MLKNPGTYVIVAIMVALAVLLLRPVPTEEPRSLEGTVTFTPADEAVFTSVGHAHSALAELVDVRFGFFRSREKLMIVDRVNLLLVDVSEAEVGVEGGEGGGPGEYTRTATFLRTADGFLALDPGQGRITLLSREGEVGGTRRYDVAGLSSYFLAEAVAGWRDGTVLVRDGISTSEWPRGRSSNPARYVALREDGGSEVVAEAEGDEVYVAETGLRLSGEVVFGHRTLDVAFEEGVAVAETRDGTIKLLDGDGNVLTRMAIPWEAREVTDDQVRLASEERAALNQRFLTRAGAIMAQRGRDLSAPGGDASSSISVNEVAPAADQLLVDFDNRLWVRRYRLPGDPDVRWRMVNIDGGGVTRELRLQPNARLLDAHEDLVLLRLESELGVVHVEVKPMVPRTR